jgi:hypothetical protein
MKMIITATTDNRFLGHTFELEDNPIILPGTAIYVERQIPLPDGIRFVNSNYIIDARWA